MAAVSMGCLSLFFVLMALIANKYVDEPVRKWLTMHTKGIKTKIQLAFKLA